MNAFARLMLFASICAIAVRAEDSPREVQPAPEAPKTEIDEPALPAPERNPADSGPSLLPESNELTEHVPAEHPASRRDTTAAKSVNVEENDRFESIRSQAMNNPRAAYLLKRATHASGSAAKRSYMRAYYRNVAEHMRKLDPKLSASINAYEEAKIRDLGGGKASTHATHHRVVNRSASRKTRYASHHSRSHRHHHYDRAMVDYEPYGPDFVPYYYDPPVVFYP
jgi:type IV secretory pathway VirB10-like protein